MNPEHVIPSACTIEIFNEGRWHTAAVVERTGANAGVEGAVRFGYELEYALEYFDARDARALSWTQPVSLDHTSYPRWPGFLVDLLPQGYGRQELMRQLQIPVRAERNADWQLLVAGASNPIGNLRIREAVDWLQTSGRSDPVSFSWEEVAERGDQFADDLVAQGLSVLGSCCLQGEWPKILLTEDANGRLYLDHVLPDGRAHRHWLVKFARGRHPLLSEILALEVAYIELARRLGLRVHGSLELFGRALFIPRFDREVTAEGVVRQGQESLYALCQRGGFGASLSHNEVCRLLAQACSDPVAEVLEYLKRDMANVVLGNKDNHGRNTALQSLSDGRIQLSPLYDFAPMFLHPDGIARRIRWDKDDGGHPDWRSATEQAAEAAGLEAGPILAELRNYGKSICQLPEWMEYLGVRTSIISTLLPTIKKASHQIGMFPSLG